MVMISLTSFLGPLDSCGWEMGCLIPHVHTQIRMPEQVSVSVIDVETPHGLMTDQFKRVSFIFRDFKLSMSPHGLLVTRF